MTATEQQQDLFETDPDIKTRRFKVRVACIQDFLAGRRDNPNPLAVELNSGHILGRATAHQGAPR